MAELTVQQALNLALEHHRGGRLAQAEQMYRQVLARQPKHPDALYRLGVIAAAMGRSDAAVDLIGRAVALRPDDPALHGALGNALLAKGQLAEAIAAYRQAIVLRPDFGEAYCNMGSALLAKGQLQEAIAAYRQTIALKPAFAEAHSNLGTALKDKGELQEAVIAFRRAIALKPAFAEAHYNLGNVLRDQRQLEEAVAAYRQAIALKADYAEAHSNLGTALLHRGEVDQAVAAYRQAIALKPAFAEAHSNLGTALKDKGELDEAVVAFRRAIALKPDFAQAHSNLGNALQDKGELEEAVVAFRHAIALKPDFAEAHYNLGNALNNQGQLDQALASYRRALAVQPGYRPAHSNLLFNLHYHAGYEATAIFQEHRRWNQVHAEPFARDIRPHPHDRSPERRLRIGYVSPDFREHSVARFFGPLLTAHDRGQVEIFCYAHIPQPDQVTQFVQEHCDTWREITKLSDAQAAQLVRQDQIDILVDLAGHTADNRLLIFARKPAPVQVTYLGYPATTGLAAIDYRLSDAYADPPGLTDALYTEKLIRLPECFLCYSSATEVPMVAQPPVLSAGHITFASFNNFAKISPPLLDAWAKILHAVPGSRLILKASRLGDAGVQQHARQLFQQRGVASERLELLGTHLSVQQHLEFYNRVDLALDTFPYNGTTTTCQALWMGVPVIGLAGNTHVSRVGVSLLSNVGLPELIAATPQAYAELAAKLAGDLPRLGALRAGLRQRMHLSPLMDAPRFAGHIEAAYRQMWRTWCHQGPAKT